MLNIPIKIGKKNYKITSDTNNYILSERKIVKKKYIWVSIKWYSTLAGLMDGILEMKLKHSEAKSINELQHDLKKYKDQLRGLYETEGCTSD